MTKANFRLICILGAVTLLAGCEQLRDLRDMIEEKPAPPPRPASTPQATRPPAAKPAAPAPKPATGGAAAAVVAPAAPAAINPLGMSDDQTRAALGAPAETKPNPPGQQWLYKARGCEVSLHLYPDVERGGFYVVDAAADGAPLDQCLGRVQAGAGAKAAPRSR